VVPSSLHVRLRRPRCAFSPYRWAVESIPPILQALANSLSEGLHPVDARFSLSLSHPGAVYGINMSRASKVLSLISSAAGQCFHSFPLPQPPTTYHYPVLPENPACRSAQKNRTGDAQSRHSDAQLHPFRVSSQQKNPLKSFRKWLRLTRPQALARTPSSTVDSFSRMHAYAVYLFDPRRDRDFLM
jgi:hypothetical protein